MASADASTAPSGTKGIGATPQAGQNITHEEQNYTTIKEGLAHILVPHGIPTSTDPQMSKEDTQKQQVFYNPIQQFNRDLSVLAIKTFGLDSVQRKTIRHESNRKKMEKKRQRKQEFAAAEQEKEDVATETEPVDGDAVEGQSAEDAESKKRKLESIEGGADEEDAPAKKQRIENSEENGATKPNTNGGSPPWVAPFSILDALSATGLRALRYAQEIPFATSVTANDMSAKAVSSIKLNVKHNKLEDKITANTGNAIAYMYSFCDKKGFDVIDLDPYGTAAPFIDSAIQAINDDGLLCVTCTDSAIFASHGYLEKTYSQYGGLPFKGDQCHEGGLRLILHAIASSAARYGMAIEPLLSLSIDYYIRVFVRVRRAANDVKLLAGKTMIVYHCENGCGSWTTQYLARNKKTENKNGDAMYKHVFAKAPTTDQHCEHCGFKPQLTGPMYGGPLHNVGFIERVLAQLNEVDRETYPTADRIEGMLHTALEEITFGAKESKPKNGKQNGEQKTLLDPLIPKSDPAEIDHHPFFIIPSAVAKVIHCSAPPLAALRGALRHAGFRATMSHCKPGSIKTDAAWTDIWHIMLEWVRQRAPLKNALKENTAGYAIMAKAGGAASFSRDALVGSSKPAENSADAMQGVQGETPAAAQGRAKMAMYADVKYDVKFDDQLGKDHDRGKYVRYQLAPRENWGPMARAK